jgi:hypothetical protein
LLGLAEDADAQVQRVVRLTSDAFACYLRAEFRAARECYQELLKFQAEDGVAILMEKRCAELLSAPRPTEWDTTFQMKDK